MRRIAFLATALAAHAAAMADPASVLFVGNSETFGCADPLMSYDTANVRDLTQAMWEANSSGSNALEPHPWGGVAGIAPVGEPFMRAVQSGLATRDVYAADAATDGLIDLWFDDGTHASEYGSYLSPLTLFGTLTWVDPLSLGAGEIAAADLGIAAADALALQRVASVQLGFTTPVPEPATLALWA